MTQIITTTGEEDIKAALRGEDPPTGVLDKEATADEGYKEQPPPAEDEGPLWTEVSEEQQSKHIVGMVEECLSGAASNDPVM